MNRVRKTKHFIAIDLKDFLNDKFVYDTQAELYDGEKGIDNLYLPLDIFQKRVESKKLIKKVKYQFEIDDFDNIECEGQEIVVNATGKRLHILGFSCYGNMQDCVRLVYEKQESEELFKQMEVCFNRKRIRKEYMMEDVDKDVVPAITIKSTTRKGMTVNFFIYTINLLEQELQRIILPKNSLMHIFAITLEQ